MMLRRFGLASALSALSALALVLAVVPGTASAEGWEHLANCPVDNPAMLAVPAGQTAGCAWFSLSLGVSFNIGRASWKNCGCGAYPGFALEYGFGGGDPARPNLLNGFPATNGTTFTGNATDAFTYPWGWLLGPVTGDVLDRVVLPVCNHLGPRRIPDALDKLCLGLDTGGDGLGNQSLNVEVIFKSAGTPTDFSPADAGRTGALLTIPLKLQLKNLLLGNGCYVGSNSDPVLIRLRQTSAPAYTHSAADPHGYPVELYTYEIAGQSDDTFAEPAATGCGPGGLLDSFVNGELGLPSPAGDNHLSVPNEALEIATTKAGGAVLSQAWHATFGRTSRRRHGSGGGGGLRGGVARRRVQRSSHQSV
jgi:hypothetical protein